MEKSASEFNSHKSKSDGLQTHCRECNKLKSKNYYESNKEKHYREINKRKKKQVKLGQEFTLEYLKEHPCVDCKEPDPIVLDFDHVKKKDDNISALILRGYSVERIKLEINKCVVRCANCHRRKTAKDFKHYRYRMLNGSIT